MNQRFHLLVESFNYRIAALVNFIRAGRLTADQAMPWPPS
jgi:putative chitinase